MAVPRSRLSNARKNTKRAHHAKVPKQLVACSNCKVKTLPHRICVSCGAYGNRIIIAQKETADQ